MADENSTNYNRVTDQSEINGIEEYGKYNLNQTKVHSDGSDSGEVKRKFPPSHKKKIQMTFEDIFIKSVPKKPLIGGGSQPPQAGRVIIDKVSGTILPGQFIAIIGASGAGKTTLLNYLSGREISPNLIKQGKIFINGVEREKIKNFSSLSAYVQQDDILFQTLTVRECLTFAAKLKLRGTITHKLQRVEDIIAELRLQKCQNTKIGGPLIKGVSGGERKRCSIGVELITDPTLIFLDEPTTGLDSFTAQLVMETLLELAMSGRTIISTIHQPNSDIFMNFDRLMLMAQGKIIFYNEARLAVDYFASINYKCPDYSNPADFFMTIMSMDSHDDLDSEDNDVVKKCQERLAIEYNKRIEHFHNSYQESDLKNDHTQISPEVVPLNESDKDVGDVSWLYQCGLLTQRNFLNIIRLPQTSYIKIAVTILAAVLVIALFTNMGSDAAGVTNRNGALFFIVSTVGFSAIQNMILIFPEERPVFLREVNNNMYSVSGYFFAKIISEIPSSILNPGVFGCIVYYAIGLSRAHSYTFPLFLAIIVLTYACAGSYALIISVIFSDKQLAVTLTPVLIIPFMLFAGFFVNQSNIPIWLIEFQYLSFFKYGYQALMLNEYNDLQLDCMSIPVGQPGHCDPLGEFNSPQDLGMSILALACMYVGCYAVSLIIMKALSRKYE